jgi:hypothetical protein
LGSIGNSEHNALWVKATKRLSENLQFETNYTWSKMMDDTSYNSPGSVWSSNTPMQDSTNLGAEHSPSDLNVRQRFTFSGIYELPFKGNRAVEGWQFSLINQVQSGNPIEIVTGSTFKGVSNTVRPNILGPVPVGIGSAANGNPQYFPALTCGVPATANCLFQVPFRLRAADPTGLKVNLLRGSAHLTLGSKLETCGRLAMRHLTPVTNRRAGFHSAPTTEKHLYCSKSEIIFTLQCFCTQFPQWGTMENAFNDLPDLRRPACRIQALGRPLQGRCGKELRSSRRRYQGHG